LALPKVSSAWWVAAANRTIERIENDMGVVVPGGSRLRLARDRAEELATNRLRITSADTGAARMARESLRTVWDFAVIADTAPSAPRFREELRIALTGPLLNKDGPNDGARDLQFQLYVGAVFAMGGVQVWGQEPDLRFLLNGVERGLAVKRVRSARKLGNRVANAAQQLLTQGLRGLVVVNLDAFLKDVSFADAHHEAAVAGGRFNRAVAPLYRILPRLSGQLSVLGLLAVGTTFEWAVYDDRPRFDLNWFFQFRWFEDSFESADDGEQFVGAFRTRVIERFAAILAEP